MLALLDMGLLPMFQRQNSHLFGILLTLVPILETVGVVHRVLNRPYTTGSVRHVRRATKVGIVHLIRASAFLQAVCTQIIVVMPLYRVRKLQHWLVTQIIQAQQLLMTS